MVLTVQRQLARMLFVSIIILLMLSPISTTEGKVIEYVVEDENVEHVAISPDGAYIAAAVDYRDVYLLDSKGDMIWRKTFSSWVERLSISDVDHLTLITTGSELKLFDVKGDLIWEKVYDEESDAAISTDIPGPSPPSEVAGYNEVSDAAISADGRYIVVVASDSGEYQVNILDRIENDSIFYSLGEEGKVSVSANADYIAIGTSDRFVHLIDRQGRLLWKNKLNMTTGSIGSISISPDGGYIALSAYSIFLYARNGTFLWEGDSETWGTRAISISSDGKYIATSNSDITLFDRSGKKIWSYDIPEGKSLEDIAISSDGSLISAAARSFVVPGFGAIYVLDNPPGTELIKKPSEAPSRIDIYNEPGYVLIGRSVKVYGDLDPPLTSAEIKLSYTKPNGEKFYKSVYTNTDSSFSDVVSTDQFGTWIVNATFSGTGEIKPSEASTRFAVEAVEEKFETQSYQPVGQVTMEVGERRSFKTVKSGNMFYKYKVAECPDFILYYGSYTEMLFGGDDYIKSTIKVMPNAVPGVHRVRVDYGWSGSPIVVGEITYTYQLIFNIEVVPRNEKYATSLTLSVEGKGDTFNATGTAQITVNGFKAPAPSSNITLTYTKPDGREITRIVATGKDGSFIDQLKADVGGGWKAKAVWNGNSARLSSSSETALFNVETSQGFPMAYIFMATAIVLILIVVFIRMRK